MMTLHPNVTRIIGLLVLAVSSNLVAAEPNVQLDQNGCRILSELPPPGVHLRVFFTAEELPEIKERLETTSNSDEQFPHPEPSDL